MIALGASIDFPILYPSFEWRYNVATRISRPRRMLASGDSLSLFNNCFELSGICEQGVGAKMLMHLPGFRRGSKVDTGSSPRESQIVTMEK